MLSIAAAVDGRGRGKAVRGDRDRQAGEAQGTRLSDNQIGDAGVAALAEVVGKLPQPTSARQQPRLATPALPRSRRRRASCRSSSNSPHQPDWRRGRCALAEVAGKLPQLETLDLTYNPNISQQAKDALKAAAQV